MAPKAENSNGRRDAHGGSKPAKRLRFVILSNGSEFCIDDERTIDLLEKYKSARDQKTKDEILRLLEAAQKEKISKDVATIDVAETWWKIVEKKVTNLLKKYTPAPDQKAKDLLKKHPSAALDEGGSSTETKALRIIDIDETWWTIEDETVIKLLKQYRSESDQKSKDAILKRLEERVASLSNKTEANQTNKNLPKDNRAGSQAPKPEPTRPPAKTDSKAGKAKEVDGSTKNK